MLAGGRSSRMGRNKALLPLPASQPDSVANAPTLLDHMQALLRQAGCIDVLISGAEVGGLADRVADAGPLAGIDSALTVLTGATKSPHTDLQHTDLQNKDPRYTQPQQLLVVPVDMPALSPRLLQELCVAAAGRCALHYEDWLLPFVLPLSASFSETLPATVAAMLRTESNRSIRALLQQLGAQTLPVPANAAAQFYNLNTPQEWQQWCADAAGVRS
ncbi:molybdenum cofactor guanylyltransferase [Permianibacter sp. IMCC34836]|nr:molybdenum cofactor guanylyltransferase [Permianibacter fluminis]